MRVDVLLSTNALLHPNEGEFILDILFMRR